MITDKHKAVSEIFQLEETFSSCQNIGYVLDFISTANERLNAMNENCRFWTYTPGENGSRWEEFRAAGIMALDYHDVAKTDLRQYQNEDELRAEFQNSAGDSASHKNDVGALWNFLTVMKPGDLVFAKKGPKPFLGVGRVVGDYYFESGAGAMCHRRKVEWLNVRPVDDVTDKAAAKTLTDVTPYPPFVAALTGKYGLKEEYKGICHRLWDDFLEKWPLAGLKDMTLEEYTTIGGKNSFCYWIESRLEKLGSIWGGSAYKFGIFEFDKTKPKEVPEDKGASGDNRYRWYSKYGKNAEEVFACVKSRVVAIAESAAKGDLDAIEDIDFSPAFKWKIAFLYQRRNPATKIIPYFKKEMLADFLKVTGKWRMADLYRETEQRNSKGVDMFELAYWGWDGKSGTDRGPGPGDDRYSDDDFLEEVFMTRGQYEKLVSLVESKKNVILTGAPGVGKTFAAIRLAWSMMGECDDDRVQFVQFHQSYSYEDFICGFKPNGSGGFEIRDGVFYDFCKRAAADSERRYFFIIDEVNRGNISKIMGELLMLIEADKRGKSEYAVRLAYKPGEKFTVPPNLYIIAMMNTADRSLAMIDYALRRRFAFFPMEPGFGTDGFKAKVGGNAKLGKLVDAVIELNKVIVADPSLGKGFVIGHSYFCGKNPDPEAIVDNDIGPTLDEYWFDNQKRAEEEKSKLRKAIS